MRRFLFSSQLHLLHISKIRHIGLLLLIQEVRILWHPVLIVLNHVVNLRYYFIYTFLILNVELLEIHEAEVVYNVNYHLI